MDGNKAEKPEGPLGSEALKRDEWRGKDEAGKPDAAGHTLPASEEGAADADGNRTEGPNPIAGTMLPPD